MPKARVQKGTPPHLAADVYRLFAVEQHTLYIGPGHAEQRRGGLARYAGDVRRQQQALRCLARNLEKRIVRGRRFDRVNVDRCAAEVPAV